ncbi:flagellar biosynthetic protein FliO [Indioceanicola profundi]|uniref:flagellar biosynthetic protein FliO n=1 Tax=Indioceanicola profundi TaxID=2220096 RepID=UPI000E6ADDEA|nr:flagellar biosynthetic protein FliO [Indioceanicola profundi]
MNIADYLRFVMALAFVLGLVGVFALLLRRYGPSAGLAISRAKGVRRLSVVEVLGLDARRRLVLVRRDGVEHLLLLGIDKDLVVESGIPAKAAESFDDALVRAGQETAAPDALKSDASARGPERP